MFFEAVAVVGAGMVSSGEVQDVLIAQSDGKDMHTEISCDPCMFA